MKLLLFRCFILSLFTVSTSRLSFSQVQSNRTDSINVTALTGYGTENNWGNTGFFVGAAATKPIGKHIFLGTNLSYFTTAIYNVYKAKPSGFDNEDRKYNALFFTPTAKYKIGNNNSLLNVDIGIGPSIKYYNYKLLAQFQAILYPDGRREAVPGTVIYNHKKGFNIMLYNTISFDAHISQRLRAGAFLDIYSGLIPIEHFLPGIKASFRLRKKSSSAM